MMAFPYERVKDQIVAIAAAQNLDMEVGSTGPLLGIGVVMKDVTLRTRPDPGKKASVIPIERARIDVSPLAQLRGEFAYNLDVDGARRAHRGRRTRRDGPGAAPKVGPTRSRWPSCRGSRMPSTCRWPGAWI